MSEIDFLIQTVYETYLNKPNRYFDAVKSGEFEFEDFVETQSQFYFAVEFFSLPMANLVARIPNIEDRLEILRNVWEEHGSGDLSQSHKSTFLEFLKRLANAKPSDIATKKIWPEVQIFNSTLSSIVSTDHYLMGVACLGIIEQMFSVYSNEIGKSIVERGWMKQSEMIHYDLHVELDIKHSEDFFFVLRKHWGKSKEINDSIEIGLTTGAKVFSDLFINLFESRKVRI